MKPVIGDSSWSTEMQSPGALITMSLDAWPGVALVLHGRCVALPYWQHAHLGGGTFAMCAQMRLHLAMDSILAKDVCAR
jgi:hypothetical protein